MRIKTNRRIGNRATWAHCPLGELDVCAGPGRFTEGCRNDGDRENGERMKD